MIPGKYLKQLYASHWQSTLRRMPADKRAAVLDQYPNGSTCMVDEAYLSFTELEFINPSRTQRCQSCGRHYLQMSRVVATDGQPLSVLCYLHCLHVANHLAYQVLRTEYSMERYRTREQSITSKNDQCKSLAQSCTISSARITLKMSPQEGRQYRDTDNYSPGNLGIDLQARRSEGNRNIHVVYSQTCSVLTRKGLNLHIFIFPVESRFLAWS